MKSLFPPFILQPMYCHLVRMLSLLVPVVSMADINEDQYNQLKTRHVAASRELNRKYSEVLMALLDKVKAHKDESMAVKIRQELADIGFAHPDDWYLGEWTTTDSDGISRSYVFTASGSATYTKFKGEPTTALPVGTCTKDQNGSIKVVMGSVVMTLAQNPKGGIIIHRWNVQHYPDKAKAIIGQAQR